MVTRLSTLRQESKIFYILVCYHYLQRTSQISWRVTDIIFFCFQKPLAIENDFLFLKNATQIQHSRDRRATAQENCNEQEGIKRNTNF